MEPQAILLSVMDSARPPQAGTVRVERLSLGRRSWRALGRLAMVSGVGLVLAPLPLLHGCGLVLLLIAGPALGVLTFRKTVLLDGGTVSCPRCAATVPVEAKTPGWPVRMHCGQCGSTFFMRPDGGSFSPDGGVSHRPS